MAQASLTERIRAAQSSVAAQLPADVLPSVHRRAALESLLSSGLPTARDENWRYANLRALERAAFVAAGATDFDASLLPAPIPGFKRFVLVNGMFLAAASSALGDAQSAVVRRGWAYSTARESPDERFALLSDVFALDSLTLEASSPDEQCIEFVCLTTTAANQGTAYPRIAIRARSGAALAIVERHVSAPGTASLTNCTVRIDLEERAVVEHARWQNMAMGSTWIDTLTVSVEADAQYRLRYIATGASAARSSARIALAGRGACCNFAAVSVGDQTQNLDVFAEIEHGARDTQTQQLYRGIASGRSKLAFNGKMIVRAAAQGARCEQSLRSLLAGPEAEIAARPQLEIYTDEVSASHGATAGKLDEQMLFYLLSRGLDREVAQRLLKWAFLEDAIARTSPVELRREMEAKLAGRFADFAELDGLLGTHA